MLLGAKAQPLVRNALNVVYALKVQKEQHSFIYHLPYLSTEGRNSASLHNSVVITVPYFWMFFNNLAKIFWRRALHRKIGCVKREFDTADPLLNASLSKMSMLNDPSLHIDAKPERINAKGNDSK